VRAGTIVHTPDGIELEIELAGIASRATAAIVDLILLFGFWLAVGLALFSGQDILGEGIGSNFFLSVVILFLFLSYWGYGVFWELLMRGQTPGKRLTGLRIIREDGLPIGLRESLLRNLLKAIDMQPGITYCIGLVTAVRDSKGRRLGDLVAGTVVVVDTLKEVKATKAGAAWAARAEQGKTHQALRLPGGTLSSRHMVMIEQFLERRETLKPEVREQLAERIVNSIRDNLGDELERLGRKSHLELLEKLQSLANETEEPLSPTPNAKKRGSLF